MNDENRLPKEEKEFEERLRQFRGAKPPTSCWGKIEERIDSRTASYWPQLALAAAAILLAAVTVVFVSIKQHKPVEQPKRSEVAHIRTERTGIAVGNGDSVFALSLARLNRMVNNPEKLLDYLDAHNRPMRTSEEIVTPLTKWN